MKLKVGDIVRVKKETHNYNPLIIRGQIGRIIDCDYYNINRVYGIEFDFIDIAHLHNCRGKGKENQCDYVFEQDLELMSNEETEWCFKFGNITRTETLSLPTWDEFKECDTHTKFYSQKIRYTLYVYVKNKNTNNCRIMIFADDGIQDWFVFEKPLTKENYIKACELAKKLFLGGEK